VVKFSPKVLQTHVDFVCVCACLHVRVRYDGLGPVVPYTHTPQVQNYAAKHRPSTRQTSVNHCEFQSSTAPYSLMMGIVYDPKHVGVIFNSLSSKIL